MLEYGGIWWYDLGSNVLFLVVGWEFVGFIIW